MYRLAQNAQALKQHMTGNKFEDEVYRRAFSGIDKPPVYQGQISRMRTAIPLPSKEHSDLLAIFALKGLFPDKYRDNQLGSISLAGVNQQHDQG